MEIISYELSFKKPNLMKIFYTNFLFCLCMNSVYIYIFNFTVFNMTNIMTQIILSYLYVFLSIQENAVACHSFNLTSIYSKRLLFPFCILLGFLSIHLTGIILLVPHPFDCLFDLFTAF